jgi:hypothetical protein
VRFEVDPSTESGYRLVPEGRGVAPPTAVPTPGDARGGVDANGVPYIEVWGGAQWARQTLPVPVSATQTPGAVTGDTRGFTFVEDAAPTTTRVGDTWFDSATGLAYVWFDSRWVQYAPGAGGGSGGGAGTQGPPGPPGPGIAAIISATVPVPPAASVAIWFKPV